MSAPLADRILEAIAKSSSKHPANAADVLAQLGSAEPEFWAAMDGLIRECRIATAHIQRPASDPAPWLAIWPTGLFRAVGGWTGKSHTQFFVFPKLPPRFPSSPNPHRDPRPDLGSRKRRPSKHVEKKEATMSTSTTEPRQNADSAAANRAAIVALTRGRRPADGLSVGIIAASIGLSPQGAKYLLEQLEAHGSVARANEAGSRRFLWYDPKAKPGDMPEQPAAGGTGGPRVAPADAQKDSVAPGHETASQMAHTGSAAGVSSHPADSAPAPAYRHGDIQVRELVAGDSPADPPADAPEIRFALWDTGEISIYDGDEVIQLPSAAVARLALLLGVPDGAAYFATHL